METVTNLRRNSTNTTAIAEDLSNYISSITNTDEPLNRTFILNFTEMDTILTKADNQNITKNTNDSFFMALSPGQGNTIVLGASFTRGSGGKTVDSKNEEELLNTSPSTAAVIDEDSVRNRVTSLRMLIIDDPTAYQDADNSSDKTMASSVLIAVAKDSATSVKNINISLYFQLIDKWKPNTTNVRYLCSFYDTTTSQWNESGCDAPVFNELYDRFECRCHHLTSFALVWLPDIPLTSDLSAQDIASLVFQFISIVCFILIILHAVIRRIRTPMMGLRAFDLLPLISCASTTILFIFYIALGLTVYTNTTSLNQKECFLSSNVLMFFVYFFILYMFCVKTSIGYFNYLRFVILFPEPSCRKLIIILVVFFFVCITWVAFAAGFNSNPSYNITTLIPYKLCWFSRDVIHYFFTIPVCLFLLVNIITIILVTHRIINHVRNATSPHQSYERMKRCVIVLLSSCITQGVGWILGPLISIARTDAAQVLGWFFVIFNGLEGLWAIILYIIILSQRMDEQKRVLAYKERTKSISLSTTDSIEKQKRNARAQRRSSERFSSKEEDIRRERTSFNDRYNIRDANLQSSLC